MENIYTLGSLFDGSGGFPLAGSLCGISPTWASEVEPYPIAVTKSRFPTMKHLGSVTDIKGGEIEPVDIITFGSPCQDLSVAGKRVGLKHEGNGDDETTRSGLFMEAVRIIKEMREATNGMYPTFALWENVPGAFSSNNGADFRTVLEELIRIVEPTAAVPEVPPKGWAYADCYCGDGWSLAYRTLDAQYWGVPQRRRRIYLVLDLRGERAGKILFEREGLRGYFETGRTPWQGTATDAQRCVGADDRAGAGDAVGIAGYNGDVTGDKAATLGVNCDRATGRNGVICYDARGNGDGAVCNTITGDHENRVTDYTSVVVEPCPIHDQATRFSGKRGDKSDGKVNGLGIGEPGDPMNTLTSGDRHAVCYCLEGNGHAVCYCSEGNGQRESHRGDGYIESDAMYTLNTVERHAVAYAVGNGQADQTGLHDIPGALNCMHDQQAVLIANGSAVYVDTSHADDVVRLDKTVAPLQARDYKGGKLVQTRYIVRRLTPTECARLQGFPDAWGHPDRKENMTLQEVCFWAKVRNTHATINGKARKLYTEKQILSWYNALHTDSAEYKMWGNGIALPTALYVMQGIAGELEVQNDG